MTRKPVQNPHAILREEFDDWAILFNPETAEAVGLNPTGVAIWKMIDGEKGIEDIVAEIRKNFSDVSDSASGDISVFLDELFKNKFVGYDLLSN
jgi:SynChlorMet cassette protein ScmD